VLTISYSVEGGYTPLRFKYLGDELRCLFNGQRPAAAHYKRRALEFEQEKKIADATKAYEEALRVDHNDASVYFNLALLFMNDLSGQAERAAYYFSEALRRDSSYATPFNTYGIIYLQRAGLKRPKGSLKKSFPSIRKMRRH